MDNHEPSKFKISMDDELPDSIFVKKSAKRPDRAANKPSPWWLVTTILLFIMIGVAVGYGYLDIRKELISLQSAGTQKTKDIAVDLQSKFSSLSLKFANLEEELTRLNTALGEKATAITKTTRTLQQATDSLQTDIQKVWATLEKIKTDKERIEKSIAAASKTLGNVGAKVKTLEISAKNNTASIKENLKKTSRETALLHKKADSLSKEIKPLKEKDARITEQINAVKTSVQQETTRATKALDIAVNKLADELETLRTKIAAIKRLPGKPVGKKAPLLTKPETPSKPAPAPPAEEKRSLPKPGELIEQDIK